VSDSALGRNRISFVRRVPTLVPGIVLILIVVLPGVFGGFFVDLDLHKVFATEPNLPPSLEHPLGTQSEGRDVLALLIVGAPATLKIGLIGGAVGVAIGVALGLVAGYFGGPLDSAIRTIVDVGLTIPPMAILIMIAASFPVVTLTMMGLVIASTSWMFPTRVIRSQVLSLRERDFVRMAKLSGVGNFYIIFRELMPNLLPILVASFVSEVSVAILASIGLEVLGLGSRIQTLGTTIYFAIYYAAMWRGLWWWWLPPILILIAVFMGLFLLSIALDEIANPRLRRGM
jgi:peptide/nickel transport system permease protein